VSALPAPTPEPAATPQAALPARRAENLNAEQRLVVEHTTGPLLVLAGAGSGKTRAITERTAYLIEHGIARPGEILQITFTNKAAQEMRDRLAQRVGARLAAAVHLGTFHALCLRILRAHPGDSGRSARFSIYDDADQRRVVDRYLSRADRGRIDRDAVCDAISRAKNHLLDVDGFAFADASQLGGLELTDEATAIVAAVWRSVDGELGRSDALDFDDLLVFAVRLLERHEPILAAYRQRFRFIGVDEYQDTNPVQYRLLRLLAGEHHNLVVVADDDQAIFRFRGAEVGHVLRFEHDIPGVRVVQLTRNYRSTPQVVEAANRLIVRNRGRRPKTMIAEAADGPEPIWRAHGDADAEASWATTAVARAIAHDIPLGEVAILGRVRGVLARIEPALARAQIPYRLLSGVAFYQAREVRAALAHLTLLANPRDSEAFARVMADARRGIGEITVARVDAHARASDVTLLEACARAQTLDRVRRDQKESLERFGRDMLALAEQAEQRSISSLLAEAVRLRGGLAEQLAREPDAGVRLGRVHDLIAAARAYERESSEPTPCEFLAQAALAAGEITGGSATEGGRVALSTVHAAKGLEWRVVLVCGMEEGLFPSARATTPEELEEERRLAYVALTRAKRTLALSCARRRNGRPSAPSRFIAEALADRRAA
jgi:DNA helicase-2/ATP-dependent DNA helicase PcrA